MSYGLYLSEYHEASKAEHADPSFTKYYIEKIMEEYDNDVVYAHNISKTDPGLKDKIFTLSTRSYSLIFLEIIKHILNDQEQLLQNYNEEKLRILLAKIHLFDN